MAETTGAQCPRCGAGETVRNGTRRGKQRWLCRSCRRTFGPTTGTAVAGVRTDVAEIAQALLVVLRRGSLRAAEAVTSHKAETISGWVRRAAAHAEVLTEVLVRDLQLSEVEVDEFWSFVRTKGGVGRPSRAANQLTGLWRPAEVRVGAVSRRTGGAAS